MFYNPINGFIFKTSKYYLSSKYKRIIRSLYSSNFELNKKSKKDSVINIINVRKLLKMRKDEEMKKGSSDSKESSTTNI